MALLTKAQAEKRLADGCEKLGLTLEVNYVNAQRNVPDALFLGGAPQSFTIHDTANTNVGANARMHRNFVANGGGTELASYTLSVDDTRAVLIIDLTKAQYHAGTHTGNYTSGSVETCINSDGNWERTKDNLAKLTAAYLYTFSLPISAVVQHNVWYGKDCPGKIRHEGSWGKVLIAAGDYLKRLQTPPAPVPVPPPVPSNAINDYYHTHGGVDAFGLVLEGNERKMVLEDGLEYAVRFCEKALLQYRPDKGVSRANVGKMLLLNLVKHGEI